MRVIAGTLRGRTLAAPAGLATRPTGDRVREALFSILGGVAGARVLDLYAGTGALGIEALSRGAARATFVEDARPALAALRANVAALALSGACDVVASPVERAWRRPGLAGPFDLVLADPPWRDVPTGALGRALAALAEQGRLAPDARVVVEHAASDAPPVLAGLERHDERRYGDTALAFYSLANPGPLAVV